MSDKPRRQHGHPRYPGSDGSDEIVSGAGADEVSLSRG